MINEKAKSELDSIRRRRDEKIFAEKIRFCYRGLIIFLMNNSHFGNKTN